MKQRGAVSIFIVIFTALLVTIVTTSFVQIMLRNQQQATDNDLSQSAYDSAMAGVEDAKRALVELKKCQQAPGGANCAATVAAFSSADTNCEVLEGAGIADFSNGEVTVGDDPALNQAYTCVTMQVETEAYKGRLLPDEGVVIPLVPVGGNTNAIRSVRISWFSKVKKDVEDVQEASGVLVARAHMPTSVGLPRSNAEWSPRANENRITPPMIRAQLMQFNKGNIVLSEFDGGNARTRLLYPQAGGGVDSFENDTRQRSAPVGNSPSPGGCVANFTRMGEYACSVVVALPSMPPGQTREAYLYLGGIYVQPVGFHYMVEMLDNVGASGNVIYFDNVQPQVDATGRAGDLFRRVRASVDVSESGVQMQYPTAALSTENLCKEFFVTNKAEDYQGDGNKDETLCSP